LDNRILLNPSTFAPIDGMQVSDDYIIGPGDELQIRIWGQVEADLRVIVDRAGQILSTVGQISVAGVTTADWNNISSGRYRSI
jgi:protein involved in polysaccharide export with SLBB domain